VAEGLLATALIAGALLGLSIGGASEPTNTDALAAAGVSEVAGGGYSAYALLRDGRVWAWGDDLEGQLGDGEDGSASDVPVRVVHLSGASALAASANSAFAVRDDGTVWAWGDDSEGELGNRKETYTSELPVRVEGLHGIRQLAAGEFSGYALGRDGTLWAWGDNSLGQLARNLSIGTSDVPTRVDDVGQVQGVAAGASTAYAVRKDGTVWAWGDNAFGELTRRGSRLIASEVPLEIQGIREAAAVAAGADAGFALLRDGTVWAWGDGSFGDLGTGACPVRHPTNCAGSSRPGRVGRLRQVRAIAAGTYAAYALAANGQVWSWGDGIFGQLGDGSSQSSDIPVLVRRLQNVVSIAAGGNAAYAVEANGSVWAWGYGAYGQLGDGSTSSSDVPLQVHGLSSAA
jgi:alpha-tubulin suppressor-like RCC1 family protein